MNPIQISGPEMRFLKVIEEYAVNGKVDCGSKKSRVREEICAKLKMGMNRTGVMMTEMHHAGVIAPVGDGVWVILTPLSQCEIRPRAKSGRKPKANYVETVNRPPAVLPPLPTDTRDLTGRLMGDPVYERSALYKIRSEQNA